jgi:chromosome segregation ATPase
MVNKIEQIKELLNAGKSTRAIAAELHVSLRDIGKVKKSMDIDFDALYRKRDALTQELESLDSMEDRVKSSIADKKNELSRLEAECDRKRREITTIPRFMYRDVPAPSNYASIQAWFRALSNDQLRYVIRVIGENVDRRCDEYFILQCHQARMDLIKQM